MKPSYWPVFCFSAPCSMGAMSHASPALPGSFPSANRGISFLPASTRRSCPGGSGCQDVMEHLWEEQGGKQMWEKSDFQCIWEGWLCGLVEKSCEDLKILSYMQYGCFSLYWPCQPPPVCWGKPTFAALLKASDRVILCSSPRSKFGCACIARKPCPRATHCVAPLSRGIPTQHFLYLTRN